MLTIAILPLAFLACIFFTIACTIDKYVSENHA